MSQSRSCVIPSQRTDLRRSAARSGSSRANTVRRRIGSTRSADSACPSSSPRQIGAARSAPDGETRGGAVTPPAKAVSRVQGPAPGAEAVASTVRVEEGGRGIWAHAACAQRGHVDQLQAKTLSGSSHTLPVSRVFVFAVGESLPATAYHNVARSPSTVEPRGGDGVSTGCSRHASATCASHQSNRSGM